MADLFAVSKMNISLHVSNILKEKELDDSVVKFYLTTAADGKKYKIAVGCDAVDGKLLISQSGGLLVGRRVWNPRPTAWSEARG